jgi:hypothetical protein
MAAARDERGCAAACGRGEGMGLATLLFGTPVRFL